MLFSGGSVIGWTDACDVLKAAGVMLFTVKGIGAGPEDCW